MLIVPNIGNVFDLLLENTCDAVIVFAKYGYTCMETDWKIFLKKISVNEDEFTRIGSSYKSHHSIPIIVNINSEKKYVYFLRNEQNEDCISDSRLVLQLTAAIKTLQLIGCKSIGFTGARPTNYLPGLPDDKLEIKNRKKTHNDKAYRERVDLILDLLYSYNGQSPNNLKIHLISRNDVFTRSILAPINI